MTPPPSEISVPRLLQAAGVSDIGRIRSRNEDAFAVEPSLGLVAVADGMGGHPAGDIASALAVEELTSVLREPPTEEGRPIGTERLAESAGERMAEAVVRANERILAEADADPQRAGMGTTLTALQVSPSTGSFALAHVGDSRAYVFSNHRLRQLTRDHTWVQEMVDKGELSEEMGVGHPLRHILSRALGIGRPVEPELVRGRGQPGDLFLLCTDGLVGMISDGEIQDCLLAEDGRSLDRILDSLVTLANERGGADNITVTLLRLLPDGRD